MMHETIPAHFSIAVQARYPRVALLIKFIYYRIHLIEATLDLNPDISDEHYHAMREERFRRIATLMTLDWYSATHPFELRHELVDIDEQMYSEKTINAWWLKYKNLTASQLLDQIWWGDEE